MPRAHSRPDGDRALAALPAQTRLRVTEFVTVARAVQNLPYVWPGPPEASAAREQRAGTCASKHALLAEELLGQELMSLPLLIVGPLAPAIWPDLSEQAAGLLEVHECLTVHTPWAGPLLVDVTWPAQAVAAGLPGLSQAWSGLTDGECGVQPIQASYAVTQGKIREAKLAIRSRLYTQADSARRDAILREITQRVQAIGAS
jgi:hypothetical protein